MPYTEEEKKKLASLYMEVDERDRPGVLKQLQENGMDFDIYEHTPIRAIDEERNFKEVAKEAVTFGYYDAKPIPNAGDFRIPGTDIEIQPSAIAGEAIGSIPGVIAGYGIGSKVAGAAVRGTAKSYLADTAGDLARRAPGAVAKASKYGKRQDRIRRGVTLTIGEALPGGMNGYIRSEGDIEKAIAMAAEWTAMGLMFEGAFVGTKTAFRKVKSGKPTTKEDNSFLLNFHDKLMDASSRMHDMGTKAQEKLGDVVSSVLETRLGKMTQAIAQDELTRDQFITQSREMLGEVMGKVSNYADNGKAEVAKRWEVFSMDMYDLVKEGALSPTELANKQQQFFSMLNNGYERFNGAIANSPFLIKQRKKVMAGASNQAQKAYTKIRGLANKYGSENGWEGRMLDELEEQLAKWPETSKKKRAEIRSFVFHKHMKLMRLKHNVKRSAKSAKWEIKNKARIEYSELGRKIGPKMDNVIAAVKEARLIVKSPERIKETIAQADRSLTQAEVRLRHKAANFDVDVAKANFMNKGQKIYDDAMAGMKSLPKEGRDYTRARFKEFQSGLYKQLEDPKFHAKDVQSYYDSFFGEIGRRIEQRMDLNGKWHGANTEVRDWWNEGSDWRKQLGSDLKLKEMEDYITMGEAGKDLRRAGESIKGAATKSTNLAKKARGAVGRMVESARKTGGEHASNIPSLTEFKRIGAQTYKDVEKSVRLGTQMAIDPNVGLDAFDGWNTFLDTMHDLYSGKLVNIEIINAKYQSGVATLEKHLTHGRSALESARLEAAKRVNPKNKNVSKTLQQRTLEGGWVDNADGSYTGWKAGKSGLFMFDGEKTPFHAVISEVSGDGKMFTLKRKEGDFGGSVPGSDFAGADLGEFHTSQIKRFQPDLPSVSGGTDVFSPPISKDLLEELTSLRHEYRELYGEWPRRVGTPEEIKGWNTRTAEANKRDLQHKIFQEQNRLTQEGHVSINRGSMEPWMASASQGSVSEVTEALGKDTFFGWFAKLMPTYARHGLSANPAIAVEVRRMLHQMEEWGKQTARYLERYRAALEPLTIDPKDQLQSLIPGAIGAGGRMARHTMQGKKIKIARALDGDKDILIANPDLQAPYEEIRSILDDLAKELGLPEGDRIADYFPHIFHGALGKDMAMEISGELGSRGKFMADGHGFPENRLFANLLERQGAEGFELDLDAALYAYIKGAVKKPGMDLFLSRSASLLDDLPLLNNKGGEHTTRKLYKDYVRYLSGQPGSGREMMAQFWQNNKFFNHWVDRAVGFLGSDDPNMAGWLAKSKMGETDPKTGTRIPYDAVAELETRKMFKKLVDDSHMYTREGELSGVPGTKRRRAQLALKIEEIRRAFKDPKAKPMVISSLYSLMVVNKLGLNISHGLINTTQTLTNTLPTLGVRYMCKGVSRYGSNKAKKFSNGRTTQEVLDDMGVLSDTAEAQEFVPPGIGWYHDVMDGIVMAPARVTEKFNRGVAGLGAYEKALDLEMSHSDAIEFARDTVIKTQFPFNKAGVSPIMQTPMVRFMLMFKSYPMHQINFSATLLEDAIKNPTAENLQAFGTHVLSYVAMAGMGATVLGGTSFGFKAKHPLTDLSDIDSIDTALATIGGPTSSIMIDIAHGRIMSAARELTISEAKERTLSAYNAPSLGQGMLELTGFSK